MKIWATNGWNKLNSCILGDVYAPEYFDHLANGKVKDVMKRVLQETKEVLVQRCNSGRIQNENDKKTSYSH